MNQVYRTLAISGVSFSLFTVLNLGSTRTIAASLQDFPVPPEDIPSWVNPKLIAFAEYDYTLTQGGLGQYTNLIKGPESLFNETQSGLDISGLVGDWRWVAGVGWEASVSTEFTNSTAPPIVIPFIIENARVPTKVKRIKRLLDIEIPDSYSLVGCDVSTEVPTDIVKPLMCSQFGNKNQIEFTATITPQPKEVRINLFFQKKGPLENFINTSQTDVIRLKYDRLFDQCEPIPEPTSTLGLLALGTLGAASTLKRKLKPSKYEEKETTKVG